MNRDRRYKDKDLLAIVEALTGTSSKYKKMGGLNDQRKLILYQPFTNEAPSVVFLTDVLGALFTGVLPIEYEIWHEGICSKCGHGHLDGDEIVIGIAYKCYNKPGRLDI